MTTEEKVAKGIEWLTEKRDRARGVAALGPAWKADAEFADMIDSLLTLIRGEQERPEIVVLCGSSRFVGLMAILAWEFEKEGKIAMGLHLLPDWYEGAQVPDHLAEAEGVADQMDALHLEKIRMADRVFVVNKDGYIGDSTRNEIAFATSLGKPISYLEDLTYATEEPEEKTDG